MIFRQCLQDDKLLNSHFEGRAREFRLYHLAIRLKHGECSILGVHVNWFTTLTYTKRAIVPANNSWKRQREKSGRAHKNAACDCSGKLYSFPWKRNSVKYCILQ